MFLKIWNKTLVRWLGEGNSWSWEAMRATAREKFRRSKSRERRRRREQMHREKERGERGVRGRERQAEREGYMAWGRQKDRDIKTDRQSRGFRSRQLSAPLRSGYAFLGFGKIQLSLAQPPLHLSQPEWVSVLCHLESPTLGPLSLRTSQLGRGGRKVPTTNDRCLISSFSLVCSSIPMGYEWERVRLRYWFLSALCVCWWGLGPP